MNHTADIKHLSMWTEKHVSLINKSPVPEIPVIEGTSTSSLSSEVDVWDSWPIQTPDGNVVDFSGNQLWIMLSAQKNADPTHRHDMAHLRLLMRTDDHWTDCGNLLPDNFCPGSREWAGSSIYFPKTKRLILFFTAAGSRGEKKSTFIQRIFQTETKLDWIEGRPQLGTWTEPVECFQSDNKNYVLVDQRDGVPGKIKAFRDPAHFRDPVSGIDYLLFTGSLKQSDSQYNGVIGIAQAVGDDLTEWKLLPPIISADRLNNELERPQIIYRDNLYYLFWSTQKGVFAKDGPKGPNGLYGMVGKSPFGPYKPVNGSGLIAANPHEEPIQSYSWHVQSTLDVASFIDYWGLNGHNVDDEKLLHVRSHFGGVPAPFFSIQVDGDKVTLVTK